MLSLARSLQSAFDALLEQGPVRKIGKRIMARHMLDASLSAVTLGYVLMGGGPTAARHRLPRDADEAAIRELVDAGRAGVG